MMESECRPLLGKVFPYADETLVSVLSRSAEANVHKNFAPFVRLIGIDTSTPEYTAFTQCHSAHVVARNIGVDVQEITRRMHVSGGQGKYWVDWYGTPLPRGFIEVEKYRFSPKSLQRNSYQRSQWTLRPLGFCVESRELLSTCCPCCGKELVLRYQCPMNECGWCHAALTEATGVLIDRALANDAVAGAKLVDVNENVRRKALCLLPEPFCSWEAGEAFSAVIEMGAITNDTKENSLLSKVKRGNFCDFSVSTFVDGYRFIKNWPSSFDHYLGLWLDTTETADINKCLGPLSRFFRQKAAPTKLRETIRTSVLDSLTKLGVQADRSRRAHVHWMGTAGSINRISASRKYKISLKTLRRLQTSSVTERAFCCRGRDLFDEELLANSIRILRESISTYSAGTQLGLPAFCLPSLRARGLLDKETDRDATVMAQEVLYTVESVQRLSAAMLAASTESVEDAIPLNEVLRGKFHPDDWADAVAAVLEGRIAISLRRSDGGPQKIQVNAAQAMALRCELPNRLAPDDIYVSSVGAASLLGIHDVTVGRLISSGYLNAKLGKGNIKLISLHQLYEFHGRYYWQCAFPRIEMDARTLRGKLNAQGIFPKENIKRINLWDRVAVENALRLPSTRL